LIEVIFIYIAFENEQYIKKCSFSDQRNVEAVQFNAQIFYRVCKPIMAYSELLTYHKESHATDINPKKFREESSHKSFGPNLNPDDITECTFCKADSVSSETLGQHRCLKKIQSALKESVKGVSCDICGAIFANAQTVRIHLAKVYPALKVILIANLHPEQILTFGNIANNKSTYSSSKPFPSQHRPLGLIAHSLFYFKDPLIH